MNLHSRFEKNLQLSKLLLPGDKILIACSGGPDSVALFHLLRLMIPTWKLKLAVLHYDHGWRGADSKKDAQFVQKLCRKFKIPFRLGKLSVEKRKSLAKQKFSLEEAARKARYGFFLKQAGASGISKIATAHTRDDQAETVLMRLIQGTGITGLCGIRPSIHLKKKVRIIRPLLDFSKKEIHPFLKENGFSFREDKSNLSERFLRNKIRTRLMPFLERDFNPKVIQALARVPLILQEEVDILEDLQSKAWKKVLKRNTGKKIYLDRLQFCQFAPALQFRILEKALKKVDSQSGLNYDAWASLRHSFTLKRYRHSLKKEVDLSLTPSRIVIYKR